MQKMTLSLLAAALLVLSGCQAAGMPMTPPLAATLTPLPSTTAEPLPTQAPSSTPEAYPVATLPAAYPVETTTPAQPDAYPVETTAPGQPAAGAPWTAYPPAPGDDALERGAFFADAVIVMPSPTSAGQFDLYVEGSLPTPCNLPRAVIQPPDAQNRILVELYSLVNPEEICIQVIAPYNGQVGSLVDLAPGTYTVVMENTPVAEFTVP